MVVGLDGGYVRSRQRQEERHFEVIAGKVIAVDGTQHRFAFARNGHATSAAAFAQALAVAGVQAQGLRMKPRMFSSHVGCDRTKRNEPRSLLL